jgi:hypothetical protein
MVNPLQAPVLGMDDIQISKGFRGSPNIKRVGEEIAWTLDRAAEYERCKEDPIYFCKTYMRIVHVDHGLIPFKLYDYQEEMIMSMVNHRRTIILTSRQSGKSTISVGFILWYILFNRDKLVGILANKGDTAREIFARVLLAYEHLPKWLQQGVVEFNKSSIALENGSRAIAAASSSSAVRGYSFSAIFLDECAFIEGYETFAASVLPTISSGKTTKLIMVSTPNGLNHYWSIWENAINKKNGFNPIKVTWSQVPGRDEEWRKETLQSINGDLDKFAQEYEAEFQGSSGTLISGSALKAMRFIDPIHQETMNGKGLRQYYAPEEGHKYAIIADVSKGRGLDHSACSVIDITKMPFNQVATFYDNTIDYPDYAEMLHNLAITYNQAVILVENNAGEVVCNALYDDFEYEGVLFTESAGNRGKQISTKSAGKGGVEKGINTTKTVKAKGCSFLKLLVEQQQLIINDADTITELSRFSKKGTSYEAEPGANDDLVMGLVLFGWLSDQRFFKELTDINMLEELRNKRAEEIANAFVPFGRIIDGSDNLSIVAPVIDVGYDEFDKMLSSDTNDAELEAQFARMFG